MGLVLAVAVAWAQSAMAASPAPVDLGACADFTILAATAVSTDGGGGIINGDVGLSPASGSNITALTAAQVNGTIFAVDVAGPAGSVMDPALLTLAQDSLTSAYNDAAGRSLNQITKSGNIGGQTLAPGLYWSATSLQITGDLTLDAGAEGADAVWIFQMGSTLDTAAGAAPPAIPSSRVIMAGGGLAKNVYWQVGSSATLGTYSVFNGTIMANASVTMGVGSVTTGRALARTGAVTFNGGGSGSLPNEPPVAVADPTSMTATLYATAEDTTLTLAGPGVLANDTDADGDPLTAILVAGPTSGTLTFQADGSFVYVPDANFFGTDLFTYKANDGTDDSNVTTVTLTVTPVNDPPVAVADLYTTSEDTTLTLAAPGILANDFDVDLTTFTAILVTGPTSGTLTLNADGSFVYVPAPNVHGTDIFTYKANDGTADSNVTTVTITVTPVIDPPAPIADTYFIAEDTPLNVPAPGVLANDINPDGYPLTAGMFSVNPAHAASFAFNADGSFTYVPVANWSGTDTFLYRVSGDGGAVWSIATTVTLTVTPLNDAPVAVADAYATPEDTPLIVAAPGVLANDTDVEGNPLTAVLVSGPTSGTLALNANGSFTYTPPANYTGSDSFTYQANDGAANSNVVTVALTIGAVNDAPVAVADAYTTPEDTPLVVAALGVLANDTDVEGSPLTAVQVTGPAHGTLTLNTDGSFVYTPTANYAGSDSFTYQANDGTANSNVVTVTLTVTAAADAPVAVADAYTTPEDTPLIVAAPGVLANDTDVDGSPLTAVQVTGPAHGTLVLDSNGSFVYTPTANYAGADSFTYRANDGTANSNVVTVALTITSGNDAPVALDDVYTMVGDTALTVPAPGVLANDSDLEGDPLTAILVSGPTSGTLTLNADGSFVYTPAARFSGTDTFTYLANDGTSNSNVATVTITIDPTDGVDDIDMFLARMSCTIDWARHVRGMNADKLYITGKINPAGANPDLTGASAVLTLNGVQLLPAVVLNSGGTAVGTGSYRFHLNWRRGTYSFTMKGLDLRTVLGLTNGTAAMLQNLDFRLTIQGANLDVPTVAGTFECPGWTKSGKISRLTFNSRQNRILTGIYQCNLTQVWQRGTVHSVQANGVIEAQGGGKVIPTGDITVTIGNATMVIPFAQLVLDATDWTYRGTSPGIVDFTLRNSKRTFALTASQVPDTGIPLVGQEQWSASRLPIRLRVPTATGVMYFDTVVEVLRSSVEDQTWRR